MAKNKISQILAAPDKGISRARGVTGALSRLFRLMMRDMNISPMNWGSLMGSFITDVRNGVPNNKRDQTSIRGNLTKEFARPQMTWKVFIKAMRFLHVTELKITVEATRAGKPNPTVHVMVLPLGEATIKEVLDETYEPPIDGESEFEDDDAEEREYMAGAYDDEE